MTRILDLLLGAIPVISLALLLFKHDIDSDETLRVVVFLSVVFTAIRFHFLETKVMRLRIELLNTAGGGSSGLVARLKVLLEDGKEIDAIRLFRKETGVSLRDARKGIAELFQRPSS